MEPKKIARLSSTDSIGRVCFYCHEVVILLDIRSRNLLLPVEAKVYTSIVRRLALKITDLIL
jgi:hypothetical protein